MPKTLAALCVEKAYVLGAYNRTGADEFGARVGEEVENSNWGSASPEFSPTVHYEFEDGSVAVVSYVGAHVLEQ